MQTANLVETRGYILVMVCRHYQLIIKQIGGKWGKQNEEGQDKTDSASLWDWEGERGLILINSGWFDRKAAGVIQSETHYSSDLTLCPSLPQNCFKLHKITLKH